MKGKFIDVYKLFSPDPTPEMQKLKDKFDEAVEDWKQAFENFKAAPQDPEKVEERMNELMKANQRIGKIKRKILAKSDS